MKKIPNWIIRSDVLNYISILYNLNNQAKKLKNTQLIYHITLKINFYDYIRDDIQRIISIYEWAKN